MKKFLLTFSLAAIAASVMAADMGELPLNKEFTLSKGETYTFTPESDGILSIEFKGEFPDESIVWSNLYNASFNPAMEMLPLGTANPNPVLGQQSPALFQILKYQPKEGETNVPVDYQLVGPNQPNLLNPSNALTSIVIKCTFEPAGEGAVLEPSVFPKPGSTLGYYDINNLAVYFTPSTLGVKCGDIQFALFEGETLKESFPGSELEMTWEYDGRENKYMINLQNLLLYRLANSKITRFTITLSDFNYEISGDLVNENGAMVLTYNYDELYGLIVLDEMSSLPTLNPHPASGTTLKLIYSGALNKSGGEVQLVGANLSDLNQEPSASTNVYEPSYTVSDNTIVIDFSNFKQTGPYNDGGMIVATDGLKTSGNVMTLLVRNFSGSDGNIVQPVLQHLDYSSTPSSSGVSTVGQEELSGAVYSLQGIKLNSSASNAASLPPGIYIINGKKLWIK